MKLLSIDARNLPIIALFGLFGCGGASKPNCAITFPLQVNPTSATADHNALPPGNQVQFFGGAVATAPPGCPVDAIAIREWAAWQNPDLVDISISSAADDTNGMAVCKGTTTGAVMLTGVFSAAMIGATPGSGTNPETATVTLQCK